MPNSVLWIGLVVLWIFVLFPMLTNRHPRVRRTTDAAQATRVLHRGGTGRRTRTGPAAGHDTDPDWVPTRPRRPLQHGEDAEVAMTTTADESVTAEDRTGTRVNEAAGESDRRALTAGRSVVAEAAESAAAHDAADVEPVLAADVEPVLAADAESTTLADDEAAGVDPAAAEPESDEELTDAGADDLDADDAEAEELEGDEPTGDDELDEDVPAEDASEEAGTDGDYDEADFDEDDETAAESSGGRFRMSRKRRLPVRATQSESDYEDSDFVPSRRGRGGFDPQADAAARAARYEHRQRAALGLLLSSLLLGAGGVVLTPMLWSACGLSVLALVVYMVHLRRQVRIEAEIRRRRAARLNRDRRFTDTDADGRERRRGSLDPDSARALRRRAVVLDTDDEDPAFEQLEPFAAATARAVRNRAAGRQVRRAAGE